MIPPVAEALAYLETAEDGMPTTVWFLVMPTGDHLDQISEAIKSCGKGKTVAAYVGPRVLAQIMGAGNSTAISEAMLSRPPSLTLLGFAGWMAENFPSKISQNPLLPGLLCLCGPSRNPLCVALAATGDFGVCAAAVKKSPQVRAAECVAAAAQAE